MPTCQFCDLEAGAGMRHCPSCGAELTAHADTEQPSLEAELLRLIDSGGNIKAIKLYRESTGAGLAEAKRIIEDLIETRTLSASQIGIAPDADLETTVLNVLSRDGKIAAIKVYRERNKVGLKEAKEAVEAIASRHGVVAKSAGCIGMMILACSAIVLLVALL